MNIVELSLEVLIPYDKNPRSRGENAVSQVAKSIKAHGFNQPIVVDPNNRLCAGHTRYYAARELGLEKVPVYKKQMSEEKFIAYNLADNKSSEHSDWDIDRLTDLFKDIPVDWADETLFEPEEVELFTGNVAGEGEDFEEEKEDEPKGVSQGHVKMVQLLIANDFFDEFMGLVEKVKKGEEVDNVTDSVIAALKKY